MSDQHGTVGSVPDYNEQSKCFLNIELDLALTFCQIGLVTTHKESARRNAENARKALSTVERMLPRLSLVSSDQSAISQKIAHLTKLLTDLERDLQRL